MIDGWVISSEIALIWMSLDLTDKSTLVQVMAWCCQATSSYLSQCWPRSMLPYGVTRPQWVKSCTGPMRGGKIRTVLWVDVWFLFKTREQPIPAHTGPRSVMWLGHKVECFKCWLVISLLRQKTLYLKILHMPWQHCCCGMGWILLLTE